MGGPFRAIVGGADQNMSFAPAQAMQLDNYSTQYGHLIRSDTYVAPGQIGMVVLVEGISSETFRFEAPPGATQAPPTAGQICMIRTFEVAGPGAPPPLAPGVGVLLPIGLDNPQHLHHHAAVHLHHHAAVHAHSIAHVHDLSPASHAHTLNAHSHSDGGNPLDGNSGAASAGTAHTHDGGTYSVANHTTAGPTTPNTSTVNFGNSPGSSAANSGNATPGDSDNATPGDSDLENVQHTHP